MQSIRVVWDEEQEQSVMQVCLLSAKAQPGTLHGRVARIAIFKKLPVENPQ